MKTIRSFISVPLAPLITAGAAKLIKKLKPFDEGIKWVPLDNFHLTLKFLGEVDNTEVPTICNRLREIAEDYDPFELSFAGMRAMPSGQRPRILSVKVADESGSLVQLVGELETSMADLGFKQEPRDYVPHLTLGRTRSNTRRVSEAVIAEMERLGDYHLGEQVVDEIQLMASFLDKGGPTYQTMDTIEL
ncbi:RNA 2',3'-cyclic phosphodiesterase [Stieleria varia]|uniref:RNA 2',3'-cyclic phosphodiesterase n=1 Tax=Stieleria varia TaxID=2528005 RepID=A0A5C6B6J7_9BACT|nr:RNA 2',3'-cyclic phosphodiesterase [Stieleria varia]TWU07915.1 2',5' RNA ligase family [Stieleria varia]